MNAGQTKQDSNVVTNRDESFSRCTGSYSAFPLACTVFLFTSIAYGVAILIFMSRYHKKSNNKSVQTEPIMTVVTVLDPGGCMPTSIVCKQ